MKFQLSFKKKVIVTIIGVTLFFGAVATALVFGMIQQAIDTLAIKYLESVTAQQKHMLEMTFESARTFARDLANDPRVIAYLEEDGTRMQDPELVKHFMELDPTQKYDSINIMDATGLDRTSTLASSVNQNFNFRDYFKQGIAGIPFIEPAISVVTKRFGYYVSHPITGADRKIIGVIVVKLNSGVLDGILRPKMLSPEGSAMLVDEYGVVVQTDSPELLYKSFGTLTVEDQAEIASTRKFEDIVIQPLQYDWVTPDWKALRETQVFKAYDTQHERDEIISVTRIERTPLFLVIEESTESFGAAAGRIAGVISFFVVLTAFAASFVLFILVSRLLRPLTLLKNTAIKISKGNLGETIAIETGDEFEELGTAFNTMVARLSDVYTNLEEKVWQRTADFEKFRLAVEAVSDPVVITDIDGRILYANKAMEILTGYTRAEMIGIKPSLWGRQMPTEFYTHLWRTIKTEKKEFHGEVTNKRKNGNRFLAELHIAPLLMEGNKLYGFVSIQRDITARREADKAKTEFVSIASHQLRTPLAVVNWYIEMLSKGEVGKMNDEQLKYLEQIHVASKRMVDLVNSLLSVSRIDLGTIEIEPEPVELEKVSDSILTEMEQTIKEKGLHVIKRYDPQLQQVNADPALIRVIFQNLISNAIKYTAQGGIISITIEKKGTTEALISVSDNGYGIPVAQQARIFEKFFRADNARERQPDGNGLGLYIVKSIVERAHGTIWFESEENKGSTFYVALPVAEPRKETQENA